MNSTKLLMQSFIYIFPDRHTQLQITNVDCTEDYEFNTMSISTENMKSHTIPSFKNISVNILQYAQTFYSLFKKRRVLFVAVHINIESQAGLDWKRP